MPTIGIDQLPAPVLGRIFALAGTHPNDILAILTTSKQWCAVAEQECTSWWDSLTLDMEKLLPQQGASERTWTDALAGMQKRAGKLRSLSIASYRLDCTCFTQLLSQAADSGAAALQNLQVNAILQDSLRLTCQVIGRLQSLQSLTLGLDASNWHDNELDMFLPTSSLPALAPLSTLTQLRDLKIDLPRYFGVVPQELFSGMVHLTRLVFLNQNHTGRRRGRSFTVLPWRRPAADSAPLRELQLQRAVLHYPLGSAHTTLGQLTRLRLDDLELQFGNTWEDEHLAALCALEQLQCLELKDYATPLQLLDCLPRFRHLTRLQVALLRPPGDGPEAEDLEDEQERVAWAAVLGCTQLRELSLSGHCLYGGTVDMPYLPPGSLQQLTRLEMEVDYCPEPVPLLPMCHLPALRCLVIDGRNEFVTLSPVLTRLTTLRDLVFRWCMLFHSEEDADVRSQLAALSQLELLDMATCSTGRDFWVPAPGGLPNLRMLDAGDFSIENLPAVCQLAASAEQLDVSGAKARNAGHRIQASHVELFQPLASLRTLLLPLRPAGFGFELGAQRQAELEVVEHFRRELPGVEVEGVEPLTAAEDEQRAGWWLGGAGRGLMGIEGGGFSSDEEEGDVSEGSDSGDEGGGSSGSEGSSEQGELGGGSLEGEEEGGSGGSSADEED